ncbi:hypothetical protein [Pseudanabaena sp. FACHB-2040]|uniref:hypothetical protein n=1 Tax=Pseudanabaena sp. FACHB-2040 TaxID=2692859 RepID=UPI0016884001|nr:hypothetical protein [Pseudanabaena sp. FACHB-2040]MBD0267031.1 hypothetical protein [Cyanobacteria bacterium Co-bin8]MBD2259686.1 hypothetical protein [Pseudanabaena sp. FACHB-2040]
MDLFDQATPQRCRIGKVVKSNSHHDYVVQVDDQQDVSAPPCAEDFGFGQFVSLENENRHWAVGLVYNSQLSNPMFLNSGPRLSSEPDPLFTPDLVQETRILLGVVLIGTLELDDGTCHGWHGIPRAVVPVNTPVYQMSGEEVYRFHLSPQGQPQFSYYSQLLRSGGTFATQLAQQVLTQLIDSGLFQGADQRALTVLCRELTWKNTMSAMR